MNQIKTLIDEMSGEETINLRSRFQSNPLLTEMAKDSIRLLDEAISSKNLVMYYSSNI